jgi:hypothetical protein
VKNYGADAVIKEVFLHDAIPSASKIYPASPFARPALARVNK